MENDPTDQYLARLQRAQRIAEWMRLGQREPFTSPASARIVSWNNAPCVGCGSTRSHLRFFIVDVSGPICRACYRGAVAIFKARAHGRLARGIE